MVPDGYFPNMRTDECQKECGKDPKCRVMVSVVEPIMAQKSPAKAKKGAAKAKKGPAKGNESMFSFVEVETATGAPKASVAQSSTRVGMKRACFFKTSVQFSKCDVVQDIFIKKKLGWSSEPGYDCKAIKDVSNSSMKTLDECKALCAKAAKCKAIQMNRGIVGPSKKGTCTLKTSAAISKCKPMHPNVIWLKQIPLATDKLKVATTPGENKIQVVLPAKFAVGDNIKIGSGEMADEVKVVAVGKHITIDTALSREYNGGTPVMLVKKLGKKLPPLQSGSQPDKMTQDERAEVEIVRAEHAKDIAHRASARAEYLMKMSTENKARASKLKSKEKEQLLAKAQKQKETAERMKSLSSRMDKRAVKLEMAAKVHKKFKGGKSKKSDDTQLQAQINKDEKKKGNSAALQAREAMRRKITKIKGCITKTEKKVKKDTIASKKAKAAAIKMMAVFAKSKEDSDSDKVDELNEEAAGAKAALRKNKALLRKCMRLHRRWSRRLRAAILASRTKRALKAKSDMKKSKEEVKKANIPNRLKIINCQMAAIKRDVNNDLTNEVLKESVSKMLNKIDTPCDNLPPAPTKKPGAPKSLHSAKCSRKKENKEAKKLLAKLVAGNKDTTARNKKLDAWFTNMKAKAGELKMEVNKLTDLSIMAAKKASKKKVAARTIANQKAIQAFTRIQNAMQVARPHTLEQTVLHRSAVGLKEAVMKGDKLSHELKRAKRVLENVKDTASSAAVSSKVLHASVAVDTALIYARKARLLRKNKPEIVDRFASIKKGAEKVLLATELLSKTAKASVIQANGTLIEAIHVPEVKNQPPTLAAKKLEAQAAIIQKNCDALVAAAKAMMMRIELGSKDWTFNCDAGLSNWKAGWSQAKVDWCCKTEGKACTTT
eukprot:TRINITY_DN2941_c0_g1_i2.p1 TRINITY_DN2941_c0_g1~~TRINITY_DN2941_c0_g1_i2.p1  ORF type:complete len:999 (+),score=245.75 TRINITY_DN2941_c0_g1_i2:338-2998(+)